jgi:putative hemolysin
MKHPPPEYLSAGVSSRRLPQPLIKALRRIVNRLAGFTRFNAAYAPVVANGIPDNLAESFLDHIRVGVDINDEGLARIPSEGPLVVVSNHPFGVIEGFILNAVIRRVRPDYKFLAAYKLARIPGLAQFQFVVDPLKQSRKRRINPAAWHNVFKWVRRGGAFVVFPAGRVSRFNFRRRRITDVAWSPHVAALVRRTGAPVLPVYFPGSNGIFFQLIGLIYGELQNFLLVSELNKMHGRRFQLRIGEVIGPDGWAVFDSDRKLIDYLRERTYALADGAGSADYVQIIGAGKSTIS